MAKRKVYYRFTDIEWKIDTGGLTLDEYKTKVYREMGGKCSGKG